MRIDWRLQHTALGDYTRGFVQLVCENRWFRRADQMHGLEPADLMLPNIRRQAGILSYALFGQYQGSHICATYFTGFGAVVEKHGMVGTPAFGISNPKPAFSVEAGDEPPFVAGISDDAYAAAIGAPLPAPNISVIPICLEHGETEAKDEGS